MARTTPKPPTRRTRNSPLRPLRATLPRHPRAPARNRTAHQSEPPRRPFRGTLAEARPHQSAPVSGGRHVRLQGDALGDGRHGEKPRTRSATGIHPRQPQAGSRHRVRIRPPARPGIGLHSRHRPWQRPGHRNLTHPIYRRLYATSRVKTLLRVLECLSCLVSAAVRNSQQEAARPCANQTVSSA